MMMRKNPSFPPTKCWIKKTVHPIRKTSSWSQKHKKNHSSAIYGWNCEFGPSSLNGTVEHKPILEKIHPWKLACPLKSDHFSREYIFQPSIFWGHVSFQGSMRKSSFRVLFLSKFGGKKSFKVSHEQKKNGLTFHGTSWLFKRDSYVMVYYNWLVVSTHLKNIGQIGSYPQMEVT